MTRISYGVPNLIGGVSQQPPAVRFPNQLEEQLNAWASPIDGLTKRPPTRHLAELVAGSAGTPYVHVIHRDETEKYVALFDTTGIQVFGLDGTEYEVHKPGGGAPTLTYLTGGSPTPSEDYRAVTIADYTLLANGKQAVQMDAALSPDFDDLHASNAYGFVFVRQAAYSTTYEVTIRLNHGGGFPTGEYTVSYTSAGTGTMDTDAIAAQLVTLMNGANWTQTGGASGIDLNTGGYITADRVGSTIRISYNLGKGGSMDYVQSSDGIGDTGLVAFYRSIQRYTDLPLVCYSGELLEILGDADADIDNYWVKFVADDPARPFGEGSWVQTVAAGEEYKFDEDTMPWQLIRKQDDVSGTITGTPFAIYFEWAAATWVDKASGDETRNPNPSFVSTATEDRFITSIFLHKNRLGFLSGENVIFSGAGDFYNFWRTTLLQLLDGDPIDIAAAHTKVATQRHAVPFNERLLTFSDRTQFVVDGEPILTPATAQITPVTEYECSPDVAPAVVGRGIYFGYKNGDYSEMREMFQLGDSALFDAQNVASQVPHYVEGKITTMAASDLHNVVALSTDGAPNVLYVYQFFWSGQDKVQSAWGKWVFTEDAEIKQVAFIEDEMILVVQRTSGLSLELVTLGNGLVDTGVSFLTLLDRRVTENDCVSTYDPVTDATTIELPYNTVVDEEYQVVDRGVTNPQSYTVLQVATDYIIVRGDLSGGARPFYLGVKYVFRGELSLPLLRQPRQSGGTSPVVTGRKQVRYGILAYSDTRYFQVEVTPELRDTSVATFSPEIVGAALVDGFLVPDGTFRFPVMADAEHVAIAITNDSPWPCKLSSLDYEVEYADRSRRFG